jgi:hypothetical protein
LSAKMIPPSTTVAHAVICVLPDAVTDRSDWRILGEETGSGVGGIYPAAIGIYEIVGDRQSLLVDTFGATHNT